MRSIDLLKKIILILLCACMLVAYVGCDNGANEETQNEKLIEKISETEKMTADVSNIEETCNDYETESCCLKATDNSETVVYEIDEELQSFFEMLYKDDKKIDKLNFCVEYEDRYHEYKNSGKYENSDWYQSVILITICCDYDLAVNEEWYRQCSEINNESLNEAFFCQYDVSFANGIYKNIPLISGALLSYYSLESFYMDYSNIKDLADLGYITEIWIQYQYGLPVGSFTDPVMDTIIIERII